MSTLATTKPATDGGTTTPGKPKSRPALLWQGFRGTPAAYRRWVTAQIYLELRELARLDKQWAHVSWWDKQAERISKDRAQTASNWFRLALVAIAGGYWLALLACLAWVPYAMQMHSDEKDKEAKARERSALKAAFTAAGLSLGMLAFTWWIGGVHVLPGPANVVLSLLVATLIGGVYVSWIWDGDAGNNMPQGEHPEPPQVDEVIPDISSNGGVVAALAGPLGVKKAVDVKATFTVVGTGLTWDARQRWKTITIQMRGKTVMQVQDEKTRHAIAGNLMVPVDWLVIDTGANASQAVLHMAEASPWPTEPTPAPMLTALNGDVWVPQRVGLDLFGASEIAMMLASSSIAVGGTAGTGKTALLRLLAFLILSDRHTVFDLWNFKADGGLSMFAQHAETYRAGDSEDIAGEFLRYLHGVERDMSARMRLLENLAEENRADVKDAKVTRDLARRHQLLRPHFVMIDEFQDAVADDDLGEDILKSLIRIARKGRSSGVWLILATQNWDRDTVNPKLSKVLQTRISLRMPDYPASAQILGGRSCRYRADLLPEDVNGVAIIHPAGDNAAVKRTVRLMLDYADALDTEQALDRLAEHRGTPKRVEMPACPPILATMHDILSAPQRAGRMRSVEMAAALCAYGFLPELSGELDARARAQMLADLVRPYDVRPRPDRPNGNAPTYWMQKIDTRRGEEVGVSAARAKYGPVAEPGGTSDGPSQTGDSVSPTVAPGVIPIRRGATLA